MARSINNHDTDWRSEWEEERTLTPEEAKEEAKRKKIEDAQTAQMLEDLCMMEQEEEQEEYRRQQNLRYAKSYLKERGWSDAAIWLLSDEELLKASENEHDREWDEDIFDYDCEVGG